ncbi:MAG: M28 family peptidase [Ferruginibacter sp.]
MQRLLWLLVFTTQLLYAQKTKKKNNPDDMLLASLRTHIGFLADDKLEGRRTGSPGEKLAYQYISDQFVAAGVAPKGDNGGFIQEFEVNEGKQINKGTALSINGFNLVAERDFFPFVFSANGSVEGTPTMALQESGSIWFWDLKDKLEENKNNPHFDLVDAIKTRVADVAGKGATALIIYNSSSIADELKFEPKAKTETAKIPVLYITNAMRTRFLKDEAASAAVKLTVDIGDKKRMGHNVVGYIDNGAANTVIIGAHYDHLGYGEDHNSLYTGTTPQIHNGADDNASGTAALIELGKLLKGASFKNNNYLLISFSGEELGLFGSKYFAEHPTVSLSNINYMVNMDMVGRLSDSTHGLSIGGYGTSPAWGELMKEKDDYFTIKFDSSGTGPSDHTSFYRKDIPVLFFFTGVHSDYHKPTDDADKINYSGELKVIRYVYNLIGAADTRGKLAFSKTREAQTSAKSSFKVTLGIMPDYTFSGGGVRVDGVSEGKLAQRVGIKTGDVITQLGDHKFSDVQGYMEALSKFKKGDATKVKVKRGTEDLDFDIVF